MERSLYFVRAFRYTVKIMHALLANPVISSMDLSGTDRLEAGESGAMISSTAQKCMVALVLLYAAALSFDGLALLLADWLGGKEDLLLVSTAAGLVALVLGIAASTRPRSALSFVIPFALLQVFSVVLYSEYDFAFEGGGSSIYFTSAFYCSLSSVLLFRFTGLLGHPLKTVILTTFLFGSVIVFAVSYLSFGTFFMFLPDLETDTIVYTFAVCLIACINISLDFKTFERYCKKGVPQYYEYFFVLAMLFTLMWMLLSFINAVSRFIKEWYYQD